MMAGTWPGWLLIRFLGSPTVEGRRNVSDSCVARGAACGPVPLLISADELARLLRRSRRTIGRLKAAGKLPKPVRSGGGVLWRRAEIDEWVRVGCPDRRVWEATTKQRKGV